MEVKRGGDTYGLERRSPTGTAALRAAHVTTPPGQGDSQLDVEVKRGGDTYGLERRLQPARGPRARNARYSSGHHVAPRSAAPPAGLPCATAW